MGLNTVALIRNDNAEQIRNNQDMGSDIVNAMNKFCPIRSEGDFYARMNNTTRNGNIEILSMTHADYYQVVVVNRNTGYPLGNDVVPDDCLDAVAEKLRRYGYKVTAPKVRVK